MSALFTLRVAVPGILDPPGSTAGREGPAPTHAGDARSSRRPDDDDDDRVDDERGAGVPRWETLEFRAGNPRAEVITGRLRLYRDAVCASVASASSSAATTTTTAMVTNAPASLPEGRSPMVCVLAVPIELSVADFCQFAAALIPKVTEMRMVQGAPRAIRTGGREDDTREVPTGKPKGRRKAEDASGETSSSSSSTTAGQSYAVILSFEDQDSADAFALNYHNRRFSSLVEGECRALFVRAIELEGECKDADPSEPTSSTTPSTSSLNELPSCPVCLDRLDQDVSGCLVTTVCSHSFHASCLSRWGDSSCPVCRYTNNPDDEPKCGACGKSGDLWACLVCGCVGCGRYAAGCSLDHWRESGHCYALELTTQRVWDYVRDGFVHRLIQSKTGLVELAPGGGRGGRLSGARGHISSNGGGAGPGIGPRGDGGRPGEIVAYGQTVSRRRGKGDSQDDGGSSYTTTGGVGWLDEGLDEYDADYPLDEGLEEALVSSKLDAIHTEYSALLTSQLDSQRRYFEGLMAANTAERDGALSAAEAAESRAKVIAGAVDDARDARAKLQEAHKKIDESLAKNAKLEEERDFLKQLNDTLLENQRQLRASLDAAEDKSRDSRDAKDAKIVDLEEQVRDLMVFLDAQTRLGEETGTGGDVIDGGDVVGVGDGEEPPSRDAAHARLQGKLRARRKSGR